MMKVMFLLLLAMASRTMARKDGLPKGKPFQDLQDQINVLTISMEELEAVIHDNVDDLQGQLDKLAVQVEANAENITVIHEQQRVQDLLIATLTGSVEDLVERVMQNEEEVDGALDLLDTSLNMAVAAIDDRLEGLEEDIEALEESSGTNADGVAANAEAILLADDL